ncbi:MAG TPA: MBL fold metallo-hydrolase [Candidatus Dormibacteraeota bacterium]|jgi:L-ascorbate metabolism protein UlaG (beta-lactamase superfamily)|nr:MBL fold metallo-hydrolase [Candidatus Dormibacteraeota bacterium]
MDVTWLGHGCFRLRGKNAAVVTDPYPAAVGLKLTKVEADLITISHDHPNHSSVSAVSGDPYVITAPGEYEVAGVTVTGVPTYHDNQHGAERGRNTTYLIEIDEVRVCHLGDLGHKLDDQQLEAIGSVDVLLVPVGGGASLAAERAAEVVRQLEPRVVVPMHYSIPGLKLELDGADRFLKEMGVTENTPQAKLSIASSAGTEAETKVVVLEPR